MSEQTSPARLWHQALGECPDDQNARLLRYHDLMVEYGHIVKAEPGEAHRNLPCGWPGGGLAESASLQRRAHLYEVLETARRSICAYGRDPCDCKFGSIADARPASEVTGCCELRSLIKEWTGWSPYNRGQTVEDDIQALLAAEAENNG